MKENASAPGLLTEERQRFVRMLADREVPFVIVGGEAVRAAGLHRLTRDLDIVVARESEVIDKIRQVALEFGYGVPRSTDLLIGSRKFSAMYARLAERERDTREITHHVDILFADSYLPDFDEALREAIEIPRGSGIRYASVERLLAMKELAAARPNRSPESLRKDQGDIEFLRALLKEIGKAARRDRPNHGAEGDEQE